MNNQSHSHAAWYDGIALVRTIVGIMLIHHGMQVFNSGDMTLFSGRLAGMSLPYPEALSYTGKIIELAGGVLLILGLFTRAATIMLLITFLFITFGYGDGKIFGDSQLPFLYSLFSLVFFMAGPGRLSLDYILFVNKRGQDRKDPEDVSNRFGRYVSKS